MNEIPKAVESGLTLDGKQVTLAELSEAQTRVMQESKGTRIVEVSPNTFKTLQRIQG